MNFQTFIACPLLTVNRERKMHHHARSDWLGPIREATALQIRNQMRLVKFDRFDVPVEVHFRPFQPKGILADTAAHLPVAKAMLDGAVDAGLIVNDTGEYVTRQIFYEPQKRPDIPEGMQMMLVAVVP